MTREATAALVVLGAIAAALSFADQERAVTAAFGSARTDDVRRARLAVPEEPSEEPAAARDASVAALVARATAAAISPVATSVRARIQGRVVDAADRPVAGARVTAGTHEPGPVTTDPLDVGRALAAVPLEQRWNLWWVLATGGRLRELGATTTDARGEFSLEVSADSAWLAAVADASGQTSVGQLQWHARDATVTLKLSGIVVRARVLVRAGGRPVPRAVVVFGEGGSCGNTVPPFAIETDGAGALDVELPFFHAQVLHVHARGLATAHVWLEVPATVIDLAPEATIEGRLVDGEGAPVAGGVVRAIDVAGEASRRESGRATTDGLGRFVLAGLTAGRRYRVIPDAPDGLVPVPAVARAPGMAVPRVAAPASLTVTLRCRDAAASASEHVVLQAEDPVTGDWETRELYGDYLDERDPPEDTVVFRVAPGRYRLIAQEVGSATDVSELVLASGERVARSIVLAAGRETRCRVLDAARRPAARVNVTLSLGHLRLRETTTDDDGRFVLRELPRSERATLEVEGATEPSVVTTDGADSALPDVVLPEERDPPALDDR